MFFEKLCKVSKGCSEYISLVVKVSSCFNPSWTGLPELRQGLGGADLPYHYKISKLGGKPFFQSLPLFALHQNNNCQGWSCKRKVSQKKLRQKNSSGGGRSAPPPPGQLRLTIDFCKKLLCCIIIGAFEFCHNMSR